MVKKLWALGLGTFAAFLSLGFVSGFSEILGAASGDDIFDLIYTAANLLIIVACIIFGVKGNAWREKNLISRGFKFVGTVNAANPEGALALHMSAQN